MNHFFFNLLIAILLAALADILLAQRNPPVTRAVRILVVILIVFVVFAINIAARMAV